MSGLETVVSTARMGAVLFNFMKFFSKAKKDEANRALGIVADFVCDTQARLAQFYFEACDLHKNLRQTLSTQNPDVKKVESEYLKLSDFIVKAFAVASTDIFFSLNKYFDDRGYKALRPRFSIGIFLGEDVLIPLREPNQNESEPSRYKYATNTGFAEAAGGKIFRCDNIPKEAKANRYFNPRLDAYRVGEYELEGIFKKFFTNCRFGRDREDRKWVSCWNNQPTTNRTASAYKSTLIVPISFLRHEHKGVLQPSFLNFFATKNHKGQNTRNGLVLGFLSMDSHFQKFFHSKLDEKIGLIYADLLSLYLTVAYMFTDYSKTYREAEHLIGTQSNNPPVINPKRPQT